MRLKLLALFVAIQFGTFALWQGTHRDLFAADNTAFFGDTHAVAGAVEPLVHFSSRNAGKNAVALQEAYLRELTLNVLAAMPKAHEDAVQSVIFDHDPAAHRGLGGNGTVILRAAMHEAELAAVLVHEVAHNVDLVVLTAHRETRPSAFKDGEQLIYLGDPSADFYRISWETEGARKRAAGNLDFVSGYAMTDPFEDFAETYAYFVLHGRDFKAKVAGSAALYAKWRFMKYRVFGGVEFDTGNALAESLARPWDVTVLPFDMEEFLKL